MQLTVNGNPQQVQATALLDVLEELGFVDGRFATAVNGEIVHKIDRADVSLNEGDALEIVAPMQGG